MDERSRDKLTIETPEQIPLEFPLAGIGSRFLALAIDTLIQWGVGIALGIIAAIAFASARPASSPAGVWLAAVLVLLAFLLQVGYFAFFEALWNGQTPGKRHTHLRVIKDDGRPITVYDAVARNLLRVVDSLPGFYAVGIAAVLLSRQNKRLGDYVAGTVVVHERPLEQQRQVSWDFAKKGVATAFDVTLLTQEEFQLMEAFLLRRTQLAAEVRARMAREIVDRLATRLQIPSGDRDRPESLIEALATEYRSRARFR